MSASTPLTILCIASYEKGHAFLIAAKEAGARVLLMTSASLKDKAEWPMDSIDEIFYMHDQQQKWDRTETVNAVSYLARTRQIDRIVPLDDFDLEMAAGLREHLRIAGMGETTVRYFRDKLAMRMRASEYGIRVPEFVHVLNHDRVREFMERVPAPWVLKPRFMAGAIGIRKINDQDELWQAAEALGDERTHYLLERYVPGDIFHADSIVYERNLLFAVASQYGKPPLDVSHGGGVFTTAVVERGSELEKSILDKNKTVLGAMGLLRGVSHTEFIRSHEDGKIYFLETSARVGGAHIADLIEAATGINMWAEWAKIEVAGGNQVPYTPPPDRGEYAGLLVSLARQEHPDTSGYNDPEIVWRINKLHHVGLIVRSPDQGRVKELIENYTGRVAYDFGASLPSKARPTD